MNPVISFILGMAVGCVITFFAIMLFAKYMPEGQKEAYQETARVKWGKKK